MNANTTAELTTTQLSDALDELGIVGCAAGGLVRLGGGTRMVIGPAFTLQQRWVVAQNAGLEPITRHGEAARELAEPGDILVIDAGGCLTACTWGEAHTLRALTRGLGGVLINGAVRDSAGIAARNLPVVCAGFSPVRSKGRLETVAVEAPVMIRGVSIRSGDLVAFDQDGFVCIPTEAAESVLACAETIADRERLRDRELEKQFFHHGPSETAKML